MTPKSIALVAFVFLPGSAATPPIFTTIRVHYPAGNHTISIRGGAPFSWNQGIPLQPKPGDTWTLSTLDVTSDTEWKPYLDDVTPSLGPSYVVRHRTAVDVFPHFTTTKGQLVGYEPLTSTALGNTRSVWVFLPPTYVENAAARLPVVYMQDGENLFDAALSFGGFEWKVDEEMEAAADSGAHREAIVVALQSTARRVYEYTPTAHPDYPDSGGADVYLDLLVDELKPMIDADYRTLPKRKDTAIVGAGLGGLLAVYAGATRPQVFGRVGALSPATWWDGTVILGIVAQSESPTPLRVHVDSGDSGPGNDDATNTALLADAYAALGLGDRLEYVLEPGAEGSEIYWAQRLPGAFEFLLGPR